MARLGVFDSGVGGLSVLREIVATASCDEIVYVADSKHVPYGDQPPEFIRERSRAITRFLVHERSCTAVVIACNTATTHGVDVLRREFPDVPFVGMEPAIKPAAAATRSRVVGILATTSTLEGERVSSLIDRTAEGVTVIAQPCPGLVEQVERGDLAGPDTIALLRRYLDPMLARGTDTIVLGCTHYSFLRDAIGSVAGPAVALFDSPAAVARQTLRVLAARGGSPDRPGHRAPILEFWSSGRLDTVAPVFDRLWGERVGLRQLSV